MPKIPGPEKVRGDCASCGNNKLAVVKAKHETTSGDDDEKLYHTHYILECGGCNSVYHQIRTANPDDVVEIDGEYEIFESIKSWPKSVARTRPAWLSDLATHRTLYRILSEAYDAFDEDLCILSAVGIRTALDCATECLGIDPAISFEEKTKTLEEQGFIGETECAHMQTLVDAGNAAAHRGWYPKGDEIQAFFNLLETFLHRAFIEREKFSEIAARVPPRPRRNSKPR